MHVGIRIPCVYTGQDMGLQECECFASGILTRLDLGWLHTLVGQIVSPNFHPPTSEGEKLVGPHSEAVRRVTAQQCSALMQTSASLVLLKVNTVALDVATQVSYLCLIRCCKYTSCYRCCKYTSWCTSPGVCHAL